MKPLLLTQCPPASSDLYQPVCLLPEFVVMVAYTTSGFCGDTASAMRPLSTVGMPSVSLFQCAPASVVLYRADSGPPATTMLVCRRRWYAAAYMMSGLRGS